jgi:hypothetical protein
MAAPMLLEIPLNAKLVTEEETQRLEARREALDYTPEEGFLADRGRTSDERRVQAR